MTAKLHVLTLTSCLREEWGAILRSAELEGFLSWPTGAVPEPAALPLLPAVLPGEAPGGRPGRLCWVCAPAQPLAAQPRLPSERQRPGVLQTGPVPWTLTRDEGLQSSAFQTWTSQALNTHLHPFGFPITRLSRRRVRSPSMSRTPAKTKSSPPPRRWCERKPYGPKCCALEPTAPSPSRRSNSETSRSA